MNRLNLEAFKASANETQELESLTGGILGACHTSEAEKEAAANIAWWNIVLGM